MFLEWATSSRTGACDVLPNHTPESNELTMLERKSFAEFDRNDASIGVSLVFENVVKPRAPPRSLLATLLREKVSKSNSNLTNGNC